jgi:rubredoxin
VLWLWISELLKWVARLFLPPKQHIRKIDINATCPACGAETGYIEFKRMVIREGSEQPMIVHKCLVCQFGWAEEPLTVAKWPTV